MANSTVVTFLTTSSPTKFLARVAGAVRPVSQSAAWGPAPGIPAGGLFHFMAADPSTPGRFLLCGDVEGIQETKDNGATWDQLNARVWQGLAEIFFDPVDPRIIYVAAGVINSLGTLWKSIDSGQTFASVNTTDLDFGGRGNIVGANAFSTVHLLAKNGADLYAGCFFAKGLRHSSDGGTTFNLVGFANQHIRGIAIDPTTPTTVWVGTYDDGATFGLYKVTNANTNPFTGTITQITGTFTPRVVEDIFFLGTTMYLACSKNGVWKSNSPYTTFSNISGTLDQTISEWCSIAGYRVGISPSSDVLYVGAAKGIITPTPITLSLCHAAANVATFTTTNPHSLIVGDHFTIASATGFGGFYAAITVPSSTTVTAYINTSPVDFHSGTLTPGSYAVLAKTTNGGGTWTNLTANPRNIQTTMIGTTIPWYYRLAQTGSGADYWLGGRNSKVNCICINPNNLNQVFVVSNGGSYRSDDGGTTWNPAVYKSMAAGQVILEIDPKAQNKIYTGDADWDFHASNDYLQTAVQSAPAVVGFVNPGGIAVAPDDGRVYIISGDPDQLSPTCYSHPNPLLANAFNVGVPWTDEGFNTGVSTNAGYSIRVGRDLLNNRVIVIATSNGLYTKVGSVWSQRIAPGTAFGVNAFVPRENHILAWPSDGTGVLLAFAADKGLYRSLDYAATWSQIWAHTATLQAELFYGPGGRAYLIDDTTLWRIDDVLNPAKTTVVTSNPGPTNMLATDLGKAATKMAVSPSGNYLWAWIPPVLGVSQPVMWQSTTFGQSWVDKSVQSMYNIAGNAQNLAALAADDSGRIYLGGPGMGAIGGQTTQGGIVTQYPARYTPKTTLEGRSV